MYETYVSKNHLFENGRIGELIDTLLGIESLWLIIFRYYNSLKSWLFSHV